MLGNALLLRALPPDDGPADPTSFYGLLGEGALIGGIEVIKPGSGTVDAGADLTPLTIDARVQGVGRYAHAGEPGGGDPSTWSGFTDPADSVSVVGTVTCDDADGDWWRTRPLRGLVASDAPAGVDPIPTVTTTPRLTTTTTTTAAPRVEFPVPFCSSMMTDPEVTSLVGGGSIVSEFHDEDFETCSWFLDRDGFPAWVTFEIDNLGAWTVEEFIASPGAYDVDVITDPGVDGEWPAVDGDGVYVRLGQWMVYVEIQPYLTGDPIDLRGLAELVIERLGLRAAG